MAVNPSSIFYWNDWENDEALKLCSLAAKGLWMTMLCLAAKAQPYGHVKIGRTRVDAGLLAKLCHEPAANVLLLLEELVENQVCSVTKRGTFFCRRMVRERTRIGHSTSKPKKTKTKMRPPLTSGIEDASKDSESLSDSESLNAAREDQNLENRNPQGGRCAPLGGTGGDRRREPGPDPTVRPRSPPAAPLSDDRDVLKANAGRFRTGTAKGESDADPSQTPTTDHDHLARSRQPDRAPLVGTWSTALAAVGRSPWQSTAVQPRSPPLPEDRPPPKSETPVRVGLAGVLSEFNDAYTSLASAADYRDPDPQGQDQDILAERGASIGATLPGASPSEVARAAASPSTRLGAFRQSNSPADPPRRGSAAETTEPGSRCLPAAHAQLEPESQADYDPQREPSMDATHLRSPRKAASRTILGAIAVLGRPPPPAKSPTLKAKIKAQLAWKHCRFLRDTGHPGESEAYFAAIDGVTMLPPQELFDAVDRRMRRAGWDDMRQWKHEQGIAA